MIPPSSSTLVEATDYTFTALALLPSQKVPVVVMCYTSGCAYCAAAEPVFAKLIASREGRVRGVKVDILANPLVAQGYALAGIPTFVAFRHTVVVRRQIGAQHLERFLARLGG